MILVFIVVNQSGQQRQFSCQLNQVDNAFDVLNRIVALGDRLIDAYIIDEEHLSSLPVDAFDGTSLLTIMQELEHEWQEILRCSPIDIKPATEL